MAIVTWLAVHSRRPMEDPSRQLGLISDHYAITEPTLRLSRRRHLLLAGWPAAGTFAGVAANNHQMAVTSHVPGGPAGQDILSYCQHMTRKSVLDVPVPAAAAILDDDGLVVAGDALGYGRVHWWRHGDLTMASNRIAALVLFAGHVPEPDLAAWTSWVAGHQFFRDDTPFVGIRRFEGCTRWSASDDDVATGPLSSDAFKELLTNPEVPTLDEVADAMVARVDTAAAHLPGLHFSAGLTGGRDSRVVVAAAVASGIRLATHTTHPPELERIVASQLFQRLPPDAITWRSIDRTSQRWQPVVGESGNHTVDDLLRRATAWHHLYDGNFPSSYLPSTAPERPNAAATTVSLSGVVGEVAHSQYFHPRNLVVNDVDKQINRTLDMYLAHAHVGALSPGPLAATRGRLHELIDEARQRGLDSFHPLNYLFVLGRLPRFAGGNLGVETIMPLGVPAFILRGIKQSLQDKVDARLHRDLATHFIPGWQGVKYLPELARRLPELMVADPPKITMLWETDYGPAVDLLLEDPALAELMDLATATRVLAEYRRGDRSDRLAFDFNVTSAAVWYLGFLRHRSRLQSAIDRSSTDGKPPDPNLNLAPRVGQVPSAAARTDPLPSDTK